jgi:hypothetical protein
MMQLRFVLFLILSLVISYQAQAQEFNCKVQVNTQQMPGTNKNLFEEIRSSVESLMNTQQWTDTEYESQEKLGCSMLFIFKKKSGNTLTCDFQIQLQRPVYGTTLTTTLLNFQEELVFDYQENQVLRYNGPSSDDNLMATLTFWAYVMLGLDADSFSNLGGTIYYKRAQDVVSQAQGSLGILWKAREDKNHWAWLNALTNENHPEMRQQTYKYHRLGLDVMYKDPEKGRTQISQSLNLLRLEKDSNPKSPLLSNFIDCKLNELISLYSQAESREKSEVFTILTSTYPTMTSRLQRLKL